MVYNHNSIWVFLSAAFYEFLGDSFQCTLTQAPVEYTQTKVIQICTTAAQFCRCEIVAPHLCATVHPGEVPVDMEFMAHRL